MKNLSLLLRDLTSNRLCDMRMLFRLLSVSALLLALANCSSTTSNPILTIDGGMVQGVETETVGVIVYRGIPYAAPPVGDLRWKDPQPVQPWDGVKVADTFSAAAVQASHDDSNAYTPEFFFLGDPEFSEDCLYLNIWTSAAGKISEAQPVAVWIHGGGFTGGWSHEIEMDGEAWAKRGVILVTINYRLGVFGFLSHPLLSEEAGRQSGNYGLLDQIAALKWVKNNIAEFGGDPDNVTIFGQSAGARSIENLVMSDLTDNLFNKVITMSGAGADASQTIVDAKQIEEQTKVVFDWAGYDTLEKMREASTEDIFTLAQRYRQSGGTERIVTSVVTDGYLNHETFYSAAERGAIKDVPYMTGYTSNDMGNRYIGITDFATIRKNAGKPVWFYKFARPLPDDQDNPHPLKGAFHSSELWYVFHTLANSDRPFVEADYALSDRMVDAWTNFAKYSNPDPDGTLGWEQYQGEDAKMMVFQLNEECTEDISAMTDLIVIE